jgi:hypothetical protein
VFIRGEEVDALVNSCLRRWPNMGYQTAAHQIGELIGQVDVLFRLGREQVSKEDIWATIREFLLGSRSMGNFDGGKTLAAYVSRSVRRLMPNLVGEGFTGTGGVSLQIARATRSLGPTPHQDWDSILEDDSPASDPFGQVLAVQVEGMLDHLRACFPLVVHVLRGEDISTYPAAREKLRRANNFRRNLVVTRGGGSVTDPSRRGQRARERTVIAGALLWQRRTGVSIEQGIIDQMMRLVRHARSGNSRPVSSFLRHISA